MIAECVRGGTRWVSLAVGLPLVSLALVQQAWAERVYALVDYPAYQNGHSLRGTITTTDDAPLDSLLAANEILAWNWRLSGANSYAATSTDFTIDDKTALAVRITELAIELPQIDLDQTGAAVLRLGRATPLSRGFLGHHIRWQSRPVLSPAAENTYGASQFEGDAVRSFWNQHPTVAGTHWTAAVAVPEPTGLVLGILGVWSVLVTRRARW